jgi:hypothetical protein
MPEHESVIDRAMSMRRFCARRQASSFRFLESILSDIVLGSPSAQPALEIVLSERHTRVRKMSYAVMAWK